MKLDEATKIAERVINDLRPFCARIVAAGSVRRANKPEVKDIEIVCLPKSEQTQDLFGQSGKPGYPLFAFLDETSALGLLTKGKSRYRQYALPEGINLDLFIVTPPAEWGVILAIRTGPASFSKKLVTKRCEGGYLPSDCYIADGRLVRDGRQIPMPEETDLLDFVGLGWIEPSQRA